MTNHPPKSTLPPALVKRYVIAFVLATVAGMVMVFFAVAGRRYQLMEEAKKNREAQSPTAVQGSQNATPSPSP